MKNPILPIAIIFLAGIISAALIHKNTLLFFPAVCISIATIILFFAAQRNNIISLFFVFALVFLTGLIRYISFNELPKNHIRYLLMDPRLRGDDNVMYGDDNVVRGDNNDNFASFPRKRGSIDIVMEGTIVTDPVFRRKYGYYPEEEFVLNLKGNYSGLVLCKVYFSGKQNFEYSDEVIIDGKLSLPRDAKKPGDFDYRKYLAAKKIYAICKVSSVKIGTDTIFGGKIVSVPIFVRRYLYSLKDKAARNMLINIPPPHSGILAAMLLGERQYLDKDTKNLFIKTGSMHILAISGLHVGIIVFLILGVFRIFKVPLKTAYIFTMAIIFLYALMVGERASVWRAAVMAEVFLLGFVLDKKPNLKNTLSAAFLILVFINPNYIFDIGFIMSFVCIASIIWITPAVDRILKIQNPNTTKSKMVRQTHHPSNHPEQSRGINSKSQIQKAKISFYMLKSLSISIAVWIGIAPITAYYFHIVTPITILANLIIIPICFILVTVGSIFSLSAVFLHVLSCIFAEFLWFISNGLIFSLHLLSELPFSYLEINNFHFINILIYYLFLSGLIIAFSYNRENC